jgi:Asp-tRNA(Asn)/Glu-tRNA(Gln) amidotransferase A subunit family amidase
MATSVDLGRLSARQAAQHIRQGELSAEDMVQACLARIEAREGTIRAWSAVNPDAALAQARALDRRGSSAGPLHGVPLGVKDVFDTYDLPTEHGSPIYQGWQPMGDAACVAAARAAGAVILGKTHTAEFANLHPPPTRNPHNPAHTPGGSSSGSAAAVADFMVPLALGTQTGGSTVRPASFCGIVGFKPSFGEISRAGLKLSAESLDTVGLFGRDVGDVALLAHVLYSLNPVIRLQRPPRVALFRTPRWSRVQPAMQHGIELAAQCFASAGAQVVELDGGAQFEELFEAHACIMRYEIARGMVWETQVHRNRYSDIYREKVGAGLATTRAQWRDALAVRARWQTWMAQSMQAFDLLLTAPAADEAPVGLTSTGDSSFNGIWTALGVPCLNLPNTRGPQGLPLGVQLAAANGADELLLQCALWAERVLAARSN